MNNNMKKLANTLLIPLLLGTGHAFAQQHAPVVMLRDLPPITIGAGHTLHLISPEDIQYVDISSHRVIGDLPLPNVLRLKLQDSTASKPGSDELGALTVVGDDYIAQYRLLWGQVAPPQGNLAMLEISPEHLRPLELSSVGLSHSQMVAFSRKLLEGPPSRAVRSSSGYGIGISLNGIRAMGDYIFLDVSLSNSTNLPYTIDQMRFFIEDKKIVKATNVQQIEIEPLFMLDKLHEFQKRHRNVFVIKKATFPGHKLLRISLTEKQLSGRTVELKIRYSDILAADSF